MWVAQDFNDMRHHTVRNRIHLLALIVLVLVSACTQRIVQQPAVDVNTYCAATLRVQDRTPNTITLAWDTQPVDCLLEWSGGSSAFQVLGVLQAGASTFIVTGLKAGSETAYRMRAIAVRSNTGPVLWAKTESTTDRISILEPNGDVFTSGPVKLRLSVQGNPKEVRVAIRALDENRESIVVTAPFEVAYDPKPFISRTCCSDTVRVTAMALYGFGWVETQPFNLIWDNRPPAAELLSPQANTVRLDTPPVQLLFKDFLAEQDLSQFITVISREDDQKHTFKPYSHRDEQVVGATVQRKTRVDLSFEKWLPVGRTYQIEVQPGLRDLAGNVSTEAQTFEFTTREATLPVMATSTRAENLTAQYGGLSASETPTEVLVEQGQDGVTRVRSNLRNPGGGLNSLLLVERPSGDGQVLVMKDPGQHLFVVKTDSERVFSYAVHDAGLETRCRANLDTSPDGLRSVTLVASDGAFRNVRQSSDRTKLVYSRYACDGALEEETAIAVDAEARAMSFRSLLLAEDGSMLVAGMRLKSALPPTIRGDWWGDFDLMVIRYVPGRGWLPAEEIDSGSHGQYGGFYLKGVWLGTRGRAAMFVSSNFYSAYTYRLHVADQTWQTLTDGAWQALGQSIVSPQFDFPEPGGIRAFGYRRVTRFDADVGWHDVGTLPGFASQCPVVFEFNNRNVVFGFDPAGTPTLVRGNIERGVWNPVHVLPVAYLSAVIPGNEYVGCRRDMTMNANGDFLILGGPYTVFGRVS